MIHYLMYVDSEGDISQIRIAKGVNPTDRAVDPEVGQYCIHHNEVLNDVGAFHMLKAWNFTTEQWDTRTERPNRHAVWENGAWTWNVHKLLEDIRLERNRLLFSCDWAVVSDSPLTDTQKTEAQTYRTALRNLPSSITIADIDSVENTPWPEVPSFLS
jgi:hypothetical protein